MIDVPVRAAIGPSHAVLELSFQMKGEFLQGAAQQLNRRTVLVVPSERLVQSRPKIVGEPYVKSSVVRNS